MASLFRNRFTRRVAPRRRRACAAAPAMPLERLEPRLAMAGDSFSRPMLERAATLVMDASIGPNPVVMSKSQVVGNDVKSFVISHVPEGSVVEKWDAATEKWIDVSTKPTSSNPQELMRLLGTRVIHQGDKIQWRPKAGFAGAVQQAFQMINWDDGSELQGASDQAPTAVRNLAVTPTGVGELTLSWDAPALGDATSYTVTMTTTAGNGNTTSQTHVTSQRSLTQAGLSSSNAYGFSVVATNASGTSVAASAAFGQTPLTTLDRSYALTTGQDGSIWVASAQFQTVTQITFADGVWTPQPAIGVNGEPIALTTGLDGSIWASLPNGSEVQQLTNANGVWTTQPAISVMSSNFNGDGAKNVAITTSSDGSIWVANRNYNSVQQIADTNGTWAPMTPLSLSDKEGSNNDGPLPSALTPGADGSIWFANQGADSSQGGNSVQQAINVNGVWTAQPAIAVGSTPRAITTGLDGSIWVANTGSNTVQQIAEVNGAWVAQPAIAVGTGPRGLVAGLDGSIWVANTGSNTVQQISNIGGVWTAQQPIPAGDNPFGLTVGLNGSLWVTNTDSNTLQQIVIPAGSPLNLSAELASVPGTITLNWNPPDTNGGAPITTYTATVLQGEQAQSIQTSGTAATFEGLTSGGPISFTVTAINFAGNSPPAELQVAAPTAPTAPLSLTTANGPADGQLTLQWQPPANTGGAPVGSYTATMTQGEATQTATTASLSSVFNITPGGGPVLFTVTATNFAGNGDQAELEVAAPTAPLSLTAESGPADGQMTLSWQPPLSNDGAPVISYTATMSQGGATQTVTTASLSSVFDVTFGDGPVRFTVVATNAVGNGVGAALDLVAPTAPQDLATVLSPGGGQMTLSWQPPAENGGSPVTSYTATMRQGESTQTITTASLSSIFNVSSGEGPLYFTVTAANVADSGGVAELLVDEAGNPQQLANLVMGFSTDGTPFTGAGFFGGATYSWEAMALPYGDSSLGVRTGHELPWTVPAELGGGAVVFKVGSPNQPSVLVAAGQTIPFPSSDTAGATMLAIAAVSAGEVQRDQTFTLHFTDGSTQASTQSISDWSSYSENTGQSVVAIQSYRNESNGSPYGNETYMYGFVLPLNGKTLESITLPSNSKVRIFDMQPFQQ
jgi:streptogramin lyase